MATSSLDTECPICHEYFNKPKLLPCAHILCHDCLVKWTKTQPEAQCPLCRSTIVDPKSSDNQQPEDFANSLPTDHSMAAMVRACELFSNSNMCKACLDVTASSICLDCGDMLCSKCSVAHGRLSATSHHMLENLFSITAEQFAAKQPTTCAVHVNKSSELYCPAHDKSICLLCASTEHRSCPEVQMLTKKMQEIQTKLAKLAKAMADGEAKLKNNIDQVDNYLASLDGQLQNAFKDIDTACDDLETTLLTCRQHLKDCVNQTCDKLRAEALDRKFCVMQDLGKLTSHRRVLERVQRLSPKDEFDRMTTVLETRFKDIKHSEVESDVFHRVKVKIDKKVFPQITKLLCKLGQVQTAPGTQSAQFPQFHSRHGQGILLSNNFQTAERVTAHGNGIVFFQEPMKLEMLYEVKINQTDSSFRCHTVSVGVLTQNSLPDTIPQWSPDLPSAVVIQYGAVYDHGKMTLSDTMSRLLNVKTGSCVGLALNPSKSLHLFVDGENIAAVCANVKTPCYAMFDLMAFWKQVTTCSVSKACF